MQKEDEKLSRAPLLRYANVWEDAAVLLGALPDDHAGRYVSISGSGDNVLALLTREPSLVIAIDLHPGQIAALELRREAFRRLPYDDVLALLGARPGDRVRLYETLRGGLSPSARAWWDERRHLIRLGPIHAGRFERYFRLFRRIVLPLMVRQRDVQRSFELCTPRERLDFFEEHINTKRARALFRAFFNTGVMRRFGREPEYFRYVDGALATHLWQRMQHALTVLDPRENVHLDYILTGRFSRQLPLYLHPENYGLIRKHLDAIELENASLLDVLNGLPSESIDAFNLSTVFEYMSEQEADTHYASIARTGRRGGRVVYWNMMVPRSASDSMPGRFRRMDELSDRLFASDRAFFYRAFHVEEII